MDINNDTPMAAAAYVLMDKEGAETVLLVVKGAWHIGDGGQLAYADEQASIHTEPVYRGDPDTSSLIYETDVVMDKPGTDCVLNGHAVAQKARTGHVDVAFGVGPVLKKARVFGERRWKKGLIAGASILKMSPIDQVPLIWENAFGGADESWPDSSRHAFCLENPVGRGFMAKKSKIDIDGSLLPNIEDPANLIHKPSQRPKPVGFGFIGPHWPPRTNYVGTYDEKWRKYTSPLLPEDFDSRFYLSAAPGLSTPTHLKGTERVLVEGASRRGRLLFDLPGVTPRVTAWTLWEKTELNMRLDTVTVEPDEERVILTWRGVWNVHGFVHEVESIQVEV